MTTGSTPWLVARPLTAAQRHAYRGVSPLLAQILHRRQLTSPADALAFLHGPGARVDPWSLKGVPAAVNRIRQAIRGGEAIVVYGDFDADGVTATALLVQTLAALGARVSPYIPDRVSEGYGLNRAALAGLARGGVGLVVTVDCGIRAVDEVAAGVAAGLDFIITDHHSVGAELPPARAVINPKQDGCDSGADNLAGVGLAFRLAQALLRAARNDRRDAGLQERDLLDLVASGTVADLADLADPQNRALVREGLRVINEARRPGMRALLQVAGLTAGEVRARDLAFALGPRINAAGRLASAMPACQLLLTEDPDTASRLAADLQELNERRRALTQAAQAAISRELAQAGEIGPLIFAIRDDVSPGIVGLVAGRLCEEWQRPAVILARGPQESRASCRSIPSFNITHALDRCADLLLRHGGHAQAAGFTVSNDNLAVLRRRLDGLAAAALTDQPAPAALEIDAEVGPAELAPALVDELDRLEPTGFGNPRPLLLLRQARVRDKRRVGRGGAHLRLRLTAGAGGALDAIGFGLGERRDGLPEVVDLAFRPERNEWNGRSRLQLNLQDIRPAQEA